MHDPRTFETRLTSALVRYTTDEPSVVDAMSLARTIAATARARRSEPISTRLGLRSTPGFTRLLIAVLLVAALTGGALLVGSQLIKPSPVPLIPADHGVFTPTGSMAVVRERPTATLLRDGRVLVVGGYGAGSLVEVWDAETGVFSPAGMLLEERSGHTATLLTDGRVLVVGGSGPVGDLATAEVWDPDTMSFTATGSLALGRGGATARLLPDGKVLVGADPHAETWDPETGMFSPAGALADGQYPGAGTLLDDGRFLEIDGTGSSTVSDPVTGSSSPAGSLAQARHDVFTATRLLDGRVLVAGGAACVEGDKTGDIGQTAGGCSYRALPDAEIWDASLMGFGPTGSMVQPRMFHAAVLLADGRVLLLGGFVGAVGDADTAEVFELAVEGT